MIDVMRYEDMSPDGWLKIHQQPDGDLVVAFSGRDMTDELFIGQVEFCECGQGGGRSPETRKALIALAEAMDKDNKNNPIER